jgi:hypothetical protein
MNEKTQVTALTVYSSPTASMGAQIHADRSAALIGASQTAARSTALIRQL